MLTMIQCYKQITQHATKKTNANAKQHIIKYIKLIKKKKRIVLHTNKSRIKKSIAISLRSATVLKATLFQNKLKSETQHNTIEEEKCVLG